MFIHRSGPRTLKALQTQSEAYLRSPLAKLRREHAGRILKLCQAEWRPKTCQWIEGQPTRQEVRKHGTERFMCGAAVKEESSYCEEHHKRCYTKALTKAEEQAASDE